MEPHYLSCYGGFSGRTRARASPVGLAHLATYTRRARLVCWLTPRWLPAGARDFFTDPPKGGSFSHWQCHAKQVTPRVWPKYLRPPWRGSGRAADRAGRRRPPPCSLSSRSFDSTAGGPRNRRRRGRTWTTHVPDCGAGPGFFSFPQQPGRSRPVAAAQLESITCSITQLIGSR